MVKSLGISSVEILSDSDAPRSDPTWQEDSVLYSQDKARRVRFSGPSEIAMGASTWNRIEVWIDGVDNTGRHHKLRDAFGLTYAEIEAYCPWNRSGTKLALGLFGRRRDGIAITRTLVYDLDEQRVPFQLEDVVSNGLSWSPAGELLFQSSSRGSKVVDEVGAVRDLSYPSRSSSAVINAWTPSGNYVVLSPEPKPGEPERLQFIDVGSGRLASEAVIDPLQLLPFDEDRFLAQADSTMYFDPTQSQPVLWSGSITSELRCKWRGALYDQQTHSLLLGASRPTFISVSPSDAFPRHPARLFEDRHLQTLDQKWVRVSLTD